MANHAPSLAPAVTANGSVVFCDLDGTLVLDNSFHVFLDRAWSLSTTRRRLSLGLQVLPRLFGRIGGGHAGLKRRVLLWVAAAPEAWRDKVVLATVERLRQTLSAPVLRLIDGLRADGAMVVLATAAPELYAKPLAQSLGADCIATPSPADPGWREMLGEAKAAACRDYLSQQPDGHARVVVLTDHPDDLPLLRLADEAVIQAPARGFARIRAGVGGEGGLRQIDPEAAENGGGYWLWLDDRPWGPNDAWEVRTILSKHRHALLYQGDGRWRRIGPGKPLAPATLRRDCPRPPAMRRRLATRLRRRLLRDWLGIFH